MKRVGYIHKRGHQGVFMRRYTHGAIALRKRHRLEAVIDQIAERLIKLEKQNREGNRDEKWR